MRAPPESFSPTIGAPIFIARSMTLTIFAALVSESDPPKTVKSCAKAYTTRPSTRPWPAMTPSPGMTWSAIPKSRQRCVTSLSISSKVAGVEQQVDALARRQLAGRALALEALFAAAQLGPPFELVERGPLPAPRRTAGRRDSSDPRGL